MKPGSQRGDLVALPSSSDDWSKVEVVAVPILMDTPALGGRRQYWSRWPFRGGNLLRDRELLEGRQLLEGMQLLEGRQLLWDRELLDGRELLFGRKLLWDREHLDS